MSEGTTRGEAAAHILAREMGRRARAIQARIDDVERSRAEAIAGVQARLVAHDGVDERHAGLIDGLRADLGETHRTALDAVATGDAEVRQLTEAQASLIDRIAQRVTQAVDDNARQDADVEVLTDRVDAVEAKAAVPGPKGEKGDKGDRGPRGPMGSAGFSGAGGGTSGGGGAGTVTSVTAGTGITVGGTSTDPVITNSGVNSVTAGTGVSVSGTTALTVSNTGVTSLTGSGVTVSASTGAVTVTAPTVSGGTGISVAGSGTTALTVSATGVQSLTAGTGISVSGTTAPTVTNSGVTSIVAGTNVSVSGATGAVTVNAPAYGTTITASTIGGTAAAGTSTSVAREDHKHAFPAGAAPSALTVSSTQVTGTSTAPSLADHVHAMPGSGTGGASAVGDTAAAGSATTLALSDHRHSREAFGTPGAVTGGATAASGSATTIARSDHVHSTSSLPVLIATAVITSTTATYTFSSIPSSYTHLLLYISANTTAAVTVAWMIAQFNGDTASNYVAQGYGGNSSALSIALVMGTTNYLSTANAESTAVITNYSNSTRHKGHTTTYFFNDSTTSTYSLAPYSTGGFWRSTATITSIKLFPSTGSFGAGTTLSVYGMP